jgi:AcrR family transcriptional regulator
MHTDACAPRRAAPLPPEERRAAVLRATVPLLRARGAQVSTRELAKAAGVAEGTLFRVFADKRALVQAALAEAMDPGPLERSLAAVDRGKPLEERVRCVVDLVSARMAGIVQLMTVLQGLADAGPPSAHGPHGGPGAEHAARDARVLRAIASVLEPDSARLRVSPLQAAGLVRGVVLGDHMPGMPDAARLTPADVAACLVGGLLAAQTSSPPPTHPGPES